MEAIATRVEAIASRLEAITTSSKKLLVVHSACFTQGAMVAGVMLQGEANAM